MSSPSPLLGRPRGLVRRIALLTAVLSVLAPAMPAQATTLALVPTGAVWSYFNETGSAPSAWSAIGFDDSQWKSGAAPLGHGDAPKTDIGTVRRTAYFRTEFSVADPAAVTSLKITLRVDDGAVVYLNGGEVGRVNMPTGLVSYWTSASKIDSYDGTRWVTLDDLNEPLVKGRNVLAVEVHAAANASWVSGDATLDAGLKAEVTSGSNETPSGPPSTDDGLQTYWSDEFNGSVFTDKWQASYSLYGQGGDSTVLHCNTPNNVSEQNGYIRVLAKKERVVCPDNQVRNYSSGYINTRDAGVYFPLYGRFVVRARVPHGQGLWGGLWLRHRDGASVGEVDLFEGTHASFPGYVTQTLHFPSTLGRNLGRTMTKIEEPVKGIGDWHTYVVDISQVTPGSDASIRFQMSIDGVKRVDFVNDEGWALAKGDKSKAWDLAVTLFIGGKWIGHPDQQLGYLPYANGGVCAQTWKPPADGSPASCPKDGIWLAPWPNTGIDIDYVRVYA